MRKMLAGVMTCGMLSLCAVAPALAEKVTISDVGQNYWAKNEIVEVVSNNVMSLDGDKFNPENTVSRADFVKSLLVVLGNENLDVTVSNKFSDIKSSDAYYNDILRSDQLGLVYGYPNGTFQPNKNMLRSEAQSVMSHITKDKVTDLSILNQYKDANTVPGWAKYVYAKTLSYGIFVNYPDANELRPSDELTRAEAAVLLAKLSARLNIVEEKYVGPEKLLAIEHLNESRKGTTDEVKITNYRNIILEGNALKVAFDEKFYSENHEAGETVYFVNPEDICTEEGTLVIPANSKFVAQITEIQDPKRFNKNARVYLKLCKVVLPCGEEVALNALPATKNHVLMEGPWMTAGKLLMYTASGAAIGAGAGTGLAFIPDPNKVGTGIAIGTPVGAAVGLITGFVTPGLQYHAKDGEEIVVILCEDASFNKQ